MSKRQPSLTQVLITHKVMDKRKFSTGVWRRIYVALLVMILKEGANSFILLSFGTIRLSILQYDSV